MCGTMFPMTDTLADLTALPNLDLPPLPTLADLGVDWEYPPLDVPDPDAMSLADLVERYRPTEDLTETTGKGRRPPRWDDPRVLTLLGNLERGSYRGHAITAAGLAERTVMRWLEIGRDEVQRCDYEDVPLSFYRHIWQCVMRAEVVPISRSLQVIHQAAARGGWRAAAWFLERRYPDEWGPRGTAWQREREAEQQTVSVEALDAKIMAMIAALPQE